MPKTGISYTARTKRYLQDQGVIVGKTENFNPYGGAPKNDGSGTTFGVRQDLFGFIDMIALYPGNRGIVAIQSTGPSGHSAHKRKILNDCTELAQAWLNSGGKIELWSWQQKLVKKGGKQMRWQPRVEEITMDMFDQEGPVKVERIITPQPEQPDLFNS